MIRRRGRTPAALALVAVAVLAASGTAAMADTQAVASAQISSAPVMASTAPALIAIIIDDLGNGPRGMRATDLPGPVACAILPATPYAKSLAERAHRHGKEVLLHQPFQALDGSFDPGAGAIVLDTGHEAFIRTLADNLAALPHVVGLNNHMGSLLTRHPGHMRWLMESLAGDQLFFVDSYTTPHSVALQLAREYKVPSARRDVFLDSDPDPRAVRQQFERLLQLGGQRGIALAIGHPYPSTMQVLEEELPRLESRGVRLIGVQAFIRHRAAAAPASRVSTAH